MNYSRLAREIHKRKKYEHEKSYRFGRYLVEHTQNHGTQIAKGAPYRLSDKNDGSVIKIS